MTTKLTPAEKATAELLKSFGAAPGDWISEASCRPGDDWFPERGTISHNETYAVQTCRSCDVREQCLAFAIANEETEGIWGGVNFAKRQKEAVARERARGVEMAEGGAA